jgi:hypothetical protein
MSSSFALVGSAEKCFGTQSLQRNFTRKNKYYHRESSPMTAIFDVQSFCRKSFFTSRSFQDKALDATTTASGAP